MHQKLLDVFQKISVIGNEFGIVFDNLSPVTEYFVELTGNVGTLKSNAGQNRTSTSKCDFVQLVMVTYEPRYQPVFKVDIAHVCSSDANKS